jgi:hypothetical protein
VLLEYWQGSHNKDAGSSLQGLAPADFLPQLAVGST